MKELWASTGSLHLEPEGTAGSAHSPFGIWLCYVWPSAVTWEMALNISLLAQRRLESSPLVSVDDAYNMTLQSAPESSREPMSQWAMFVRFVLAEERRLLRCRSGSSNPNVKCHHGYNKKDLGLIYASVLQHLFLIAMAGDVLILPRLPPPRYYEVQESVHLLQIDWSANLALCSSISIYQMCLCVWLIGVIMRYTASLSKSLWCWCVS